MIIDLRSDTLTVPTQSMREAMAAAPVGDDVYSEDPTIEALQDRVAGMFGMEAGLFVPSGTQGNQICIALHASTGDEVIAERSAHIFHYENAAASVVARAQISGVDSPLGEMNVDDVRRAIRPPAYYYPRTAMVAVENTHNRHGGTIASLDYLKSLRSLTADHGIGFHCDGARIWNAMAATGIHAAQYGALFDTMSVCFSKGLGAPVGSMILGTRINIERARRWRKTLGGGMRQAGILAAAANHALDQILPLLPEDHRRATLFAQALTTCPCIEITMERVQTNIVLFRIPGTEDSVVVGKCLERGLRIAALYPGMLRAVFYHQVSDADVARAADIVTEVACEGRR